MRTGGTTPVNVATNVVFVQSCPPSNIRNDEFLRPENWMPSECTEKVFKDKIDECEKNLNETIFRPFRYEYQENLIKQAHVEIKQNNNNVDHVDMYTNCTSDVKSVCSKCCCVHDKQLNSCPQCQYDPNNIESRTILYRNVPSKHPEMLPNIKMGEIIGLNPNSRDSITEILKQIKTQTGVGSDRKWIRLGFDGVPYNIADSIIESLIICDICQQEIDTQKGSFDAHIESNHPGVNNATKRKIFGDILLTPGKGYMEINMIRSLFSICKLYCIQKAAYCLGFRSTKAKDYITSGANHHL